MGEPSCKVSTTGQCLCGPSGMDEDATGDAVKRLSLQDANGEAMSVVSHRLLETERLQIAATAFPELAVSDQRVVAVVAKGSGGELREFVGVLKETSAQPQLDLVMGTCQIMYEDMTPSECIEFAFAEEPSRFYLAQISREALETYRGMKFEAWHKMLKEPTCEAQFRRMLQIGVVTRLYDPQIFPTPDSLKSLYQVTDEKTGKKIELPHPVATLRIWNVQKQCYEPVETHLQGAPAESEKDTWWAAKIQELKSLQGDEYISSFKQ